MSNLYDVFGVSQQATDTEIKNAYRKLAMKWHPDRNSNSEEFTKIFQQINNAYEILSNPQTRKDYDASIKPPKRKTQTRQDYDINPPKRKPQKMSSDHTYMTTTTYMKNVNYTNVMYYNKYSYI